ncbi:hypothetical protein AB1N83_013085 [Pleurotus pulmonarius]
MPKLTTLPLSFIPLSYLTQPSTRHDTSLSPFFVYSRPCIVRHSTIEALKPFNPNTRQQRAVNANEPIGIHRNSKADIHQGKYATRSKATGDATALCLAQVV